MTRTAFMLGLTVSAFAAVPLAAQDAGEDIPDNVQTAIVYGEDSAPDCPEGTICVVARLPESERYRIPESLRFSDDPANTAWARRVEALEFVDPTGAFSCSPSGAAGFTGCTQELIDAYYDARENGSAVRFGRLIEAARAERLSEIDADAAAEQARVEAIEREYLERLERERASELPGEADDDQPSPQQAMPGDDGGEDASGLDRPPEQ